MYGWERAMTKRILDVRNQELKVLRNIAYIISLGFMAILVPPKLLLLPPSPSVSSLLPPPPSPSCFSSFPILLDRVCAL